MRFPLPAVLPNNLKRLRECQNAEELIKELEDDGQKLLIPFFEIVCTTDLWINKAHPFLRGRVLFLFESHVNQMITQRANGVAVGILNEREKQLKEMAQNSVSFEQKLRYSPFIQDEVYMYNTFVNKREFIQMIKTEPDVAGMVYERVHQLNEIYLRTDPQAGLRLPIVPAYDASSLYLLRAEFTPNDNGFLALVDNTLKKGQFDKLLHYLSELTLLPFELKKTALNSKSPEEISKDFITVKEKYGAILSTKDMRSELSKLFEEIDIEWTSAPVSEEVDDEPKELFEYLKSYDEKEEFFRKLITHCINLHSRRKMNGKKLLHFLSTLPMPKEFKQYVIFEEFRDESTMPGMLEKFESFRTQLTLQQKSGLYHTLHSVVSAGSNSPITLREHTQRRKSDGDEKSDIIILKKRHSLEKTANDSHSD